MRTRISYFIGKIVSFPAMPKQEACYPPDLPQPFPTLRLIACRAWHLAARIKCPSKAQKEAAASPTGSHELGRTPADTLPVWAFLFELLTEISGCWHVASPLHGLPRMSAEQLVQSGLPGAPTFGGGKFALEYLHGRWTARELKERSSARWTCRRTACHAALYPGW